MAVGLCAGVFVGGLAAVRIPAVQWVLGSLTAIGMGWISIVMLRKYLREWRVRLFGRNRYAVVRSVRIGQGGGENKDSDHAMIVIDGYDSEVDIVLHESASAGDRIRVRCHPSDLQDTMHFISWRTYLGDAIIVEVFLLMIILAAGSASVGIFLVLLRALGVRS